MEKTRIDWCDSTWNPVTGCYHGCEYCYAMSIANRFGSFETIDGTNIKVLNAGSTLNCAEVGNRAGNPYPVKFTPTLHRYLLNEYEHKKGRNIFVCSMADLFGSWVPDSWIEEVFAACDKAPQHNYLFLTKNPKRYLGLAEKGLLSDKHWYGYSATRQSDLWEFHHADDCVVKNLFVSIEPILEPIRPGFCSHCPADWVIIGSETGRRKDKVVPCREWIERIVMECEYSGIPLFMKSSLSEIWGEPLIQEFPEGFKKANYIKM